MPAARALAAASAPMLRLWPTTTSAPAPALAGTRSMSPRPVLDGDVGQNLSRGPRGAGPARRLADVCPEVDATFPVHVASSPRSAGQAVPRSRRPHHGAVANPARHVSICRPPRALRHRWQCPPGALGRNRGEGPSGGGWPTTPQGQRNRTGDPVWGNANCNGLCGGG